MARVPLLAVALVALLSCVNAQVVQFDTTLGSFTLELNAEKAPISVKNMLAYVDSGFYEGTIFHRVIPNFMAQGGGLLPDMKEKPGARDPIDNEAGNGLKNLRGTVAMARTSDINSATNQFFVNVADNAFLDHKNNSPSGYGYAVFGKVIKGMDVIDKMVAVQTHDVGTFQNVPEVPIVIKKVTKLSAAPAQK
eukprot:TRINITY_DN187_c0_g1_i2.p1 TRINITY_DN187_c0_g1~~TRINITY_DN187_c0_g1_i2.p1  ORF type:complete len:218 (-),score=59.96 TRINITY_DN187_c0_g1_i2:475-1053(-)